MLPQLNCTGRTHATVATFHEDGVRWPLHAYEADVDAGPTTESGTAI
jgi:hypothetical protein